VAKARELVAVARRYGYRFEELTAIIEQVSAAIGAGDFQPLLAHVGRWLVLPSSPDFGCQYTVMIATPPCPLTPAGSPVAASFSAS